MNEVRYYDTLLKGNDLFVSRRLAEDWYSFLVVWADKGVLFGNISI